MGKLTLYIILTIVLLFGGLIQYLTQKPKVDLLKKTPERDKRTKISHYAENISVKGDNTKNSVKKEDIAPVQKAGQEIVIDKDIKEIREKFDLKKAIIYREILEPKYKEY